MIYARAGNDPSLHVDAKRYRSAERAWQIAPTTCSGCSWYHRLWPVLRLLGLGTGADLHDGFFSAALKRRDPKRILICGSGDPALLDVVTSACASPRIEIHVLDRCATPLALCHDHARDCGYDILTRHTDILDFTDVAAFDCIVVHALLGWFAQETRAKLFRCWARLLRPGGHLVLVQRLRPLAPAIVRFPDAAAFAEQVCQRAASLEPPFEIDDLALREAALDYAATKITHAVVDAATLEHAMSCAGLERLDMRVEPLAAAATPVSAGPTMRGSDDYAQLVAVRPR
jgi:SAM-dependent methyltransferase